MSTETCLWKKSGNYHSSGCGFFASDASLADKVVKHFSFCPVCGRRIILSKP